MLNHPVHPPLYHIGRVAGSFNSCCELWLLFDGASAPRTDLVRPWNRQLGVGVAPGRPCLAPKMQIAVQRASLDLPLPNHMSLPLQELVVVLVEAPALADVGLFQLARGQGRSPSSPRKSHTALPALIYFVAMSSPWTSVGAIARSLRASGSSTAPHQRS